MTFSLFPRTVYKTKSKISGEIVVKEQFGQYTLYVQGMIQSGGIVKEIWKKPIQRVTCYLLHVTDVLILGLGGGTVVQLIKKRWPEAKIIGVEIDPEIIKIGRKFFGLDKIKNLEIITTNAFEWIYPHEDFDLIIVDLYIGDKFPPKAESEKFLKNLKKLLAKNGMIIFNWLKNKSEDELKQRLIIIFPQVEFLDLKTNLFLICRP